jgi:hypothetical protein
VAGQVERSVRPRVAEEGKQMIHYGAAGVFGGPRQEKQEPDADQFRAGDVWENSIGTRFLVKQIRGGAAVLVNQKTGCTVHRAWDGIGAHTGRPWVRVSCGA